MVEEGQPDCLGSRVGAINGRILCGLGFWRCGGGGFFYADGVGPFGDEGVTFFHRHPGILHEHLRAFAATPGEIVEEVLSADAVRAGRGIDSGLATFDHAGQIVHRVLRVVKAVCRTGR